MLGIQTRGRRMVGADKTTELRRPPMTIDYRSGGLMEFESDLFMQPMLFELQILLRD